MQISIEEKIIIELLMLYCDNYISNTISFNKYYYNNDALIAKINECKIGGLIGHELEYNKLTDVPVGLEKELNNWIADYTYKAYVAQNVLEELLIYLRKNNVKCVVGGSYVIMKEYAGWGDLLIDKLLVYLDRDIDLSFLENEIKIEKVIKDKSFFEENYSDYIRINIAPIDILIDQLRQDIEMDVSAINEDTILLYLVSQFYIQQKNAQKRINIVGNFLNILNTNFSISNNIKV